MVRESKSKEICSVCGSQITNLKFSNRLGRLYCSYKCNMIGTRHIFLGISIFMTILSITVSVLTTFYFTTPFPMIIVSIIFLFFVSYTAFSYKFWNDYNERERNRGHIIKQVEHKQRKKEVTIKPFKMNKSSDVRICRICKLEINRLESIYQCPQCNTHFHQQHLDDWLLDNDTCPVCGFLLINTV